MKNTTEKDNQHYPSTADASEDGGTFKAMLRRFNDAVCECEAIRQHVNECKTLVMSCRATADAPEAHKYNLALLALAMRTHGFTEPDAADLDAVTEYIDNVGRGAWEIMRREQEALCAVMHLPFAFRMLGGSFPDGMNDEIGKTVAEAEKELATADILRRELIACRVVCDLERIAERWATKEASDRKGVSKAEMQSMLSQVVGVVLQSKTDIEETVKAESDRVSREVGVAKSIAKASQSGLDREITKLKYEDKPKKRGKHAGEK